MKKPEPVETAPLDRIGLIVLILVVATMVALAAINSNYVPYDPTFLHFGGTDTTSDTASSSTLTDEDKREIEERLMSATSSPQTATGTMKETEARLRGTSSPKTSAEKRAIEERLSN